MTASKTPRTVGIEEEFHLVDLTTRRLAPRAPELLSLLPDGYVAELQSCVVETNGSVVSTLPELRADLTARRRVLVDTAATLRLGVVAAGAVPLSVPSEMHVTQTSRYQKMLADYQLLAREQLICGTQIHIGIDDRDESVLVAGRVAAYIPTLLALSASSPFWSDGSDTGYSSVRTLVWQRWPTTGLAPPATSAAEYDTLISNLIATGAITDAGMSYFDVRPALRTPTLELRVCDSCPRADTIVLIAALFRALVEREIEGLRAGVPAAIVVPPLGRAALWRAARSGLEGDLVDLIHPASRPACDVVTDLVQMLRPQLEASGDWHPVEELARKALAQGSSAARQRRVMRMRNSLLDVVDHLIAETSDVAPGARGALASQSNGVGSPLSVVFRTRDHFECVITDLKDRAALRGSDGSVSMTPQQTRRNDQRSIVPARTPRLRLKPKAPQSGYVDGAWWPRSEDLSVELPDLLAVLSVRLGRIDRVLYHLNAWVKAPRKLTTGGRTVRLDGYRLQPINTIEVLGLDGDRLTLLVVPSHTDAHDAHRTMMTAAQPHNAATVDGLLMISQRDRDIRTEASTAQECWESEGGTTASPRLAQLPG